MFSREITDRLRIECNAKLGGWSVGTYTLEDSGEWVYKEAHWLGDEEKAEAFFYGMIVGALIR